MRVLYFKIIFIAIRFELLRKYFVNHKDYYKFMSQTLRRTDVW